MNGSGVKAAGEMHQELVVVVVFKQSKKDGDHIAALQLGVKAGRWIIMQSPAVQLRPGDK